MKGPSNIKELRVWHWNKVLSFRAKAREIQVAVDKWEVEHAPLINRYGRSKMNQANGQADWHLSAVQALNEFLPHTTAEDDAAHSPYLSKVLRRG